MSPRRIRQYVGLALVITAYVGGIIGWSWAVQSLDAPDAPAADTTAVVQTPRSRSPAARVADVHLDVSSLVMERNRKTCFYVLALPTRKKFSPPFLTLYRQKSPR